MIRRVFVLIDALRTISNSNGGKMKRKFSNRNEPIAEIVAARLRGKRLLRSSGLEPRVNRSSQAWITRQSDRESIAGPKLIKKQTVEKSIDMNISTAKRDPVVPKSPAM